MPRRRFRLTMKKRHAPGRAYSAELDEGVPTEDEWKGMVPYQTFSIQDDEEGDHIFSRGDIALLLPSYVTPAEAEDLEETDFWVAKIRDIRATEDDDVWVRIQWYYSANDVAAVIKSFNVATCGKFERIFSDHYDLVHVGSFSGTTSMTRLVDQDIAHKYISRQEFYYRYTFELLVRKLTPKQNENSCSACEEPYSPDDSDPNNLMHFCPRPSCRTFYHQKCLEHSRDRNNSTQSLLRIMTWPDTDEVVSIAELSSRLSSPLTRRRKKWRKDGKTIPADEASGITFEFLGTLPADLVRVAEQPIVRGAAFGPGGISGNMAPVVSARRMIYQTLQGSSLPDDWDASINITRSVVNLRMGSKRKIVPALLCPQCESSI